MGKFYEYPAPTTILGDEVIVVQQAGSTKSVPIGTVLSDLGVLVELTTESIGTLSDVTITAAQNGQALIYNSGVWVNGVPSLLGTLDLTPVVDDSYDIGGNAQAYRNLHLSNLINFGGSATGLDIRWGSVDPEGSVAANAGSMYMRTDGSVYKKDTGTMTTGWSIIGGGVVDLTALSTNIIPNTNNAYDIGEFSTPLQVKDIYYSGTIYKEGTALTPVVASVTPPTDTEILWIDTSV